MCMIRHRLRAICNPLSDSVLPRPHFCHHCFRIPGGQGIHVGEDEIAGAV